MPRLTWMVLCLSFGTFNTAADTNCDLVLGKRMFQKCVICHSINDDGVHSIGPNLHGLLERPVGKVEGFKFSREMRNSEESWTAEYLDTFLESPMAMYPRTTMAFAGLKKPADRAAVICYMAK